jgi:diguanylate cyclase (GGDEF)-like protein
MICLFPELCRIMSRLSQCAVALLALQLALPGFVLAQANDAEVRLHAAMQPVDLWPAVRVLPDGGRELTPQQALSLSAYFRPPDTPHANLGIRNEPMWLHLRLKTAADAPGRWIFDVNYPSLDRVDLYLINDGVLVRTVRLGDTLLINERPLPGRSHAVELALAPGQQHELLLRVQTTSSMIVPLTLMQPAQFLSREAGIEALQGLFAGLGICLLLYSVTHWLALHDRVFGYYAASVAGTTLFFLAYNGLAPEHLWPDSLWLTGNAAPLAVLLALWGGFLFLERTLRVREMNRTASQLMVALAWIALAAGVAFTLGLIDYRAAHVTATILGPLPMIIGLPIAYLRMREGDRVMVYLFVGWGVYSIGVVVMAALLRGYAPSNAWTQHAFQIGSMIEMSLWLVLLGQRVEQMRKTAEIARREHESLRSQALTDHLTGLPNRRGLEAAMSAAVRRCQPGRYAAVFMIDLDGFKPVNDKHGHDVGDQLLVAVAKRLNEQIRGSDVVARLGGDEFVVVAEGLGTDEAAQQLGQKLLAAFNAPFGLAGDTDCHIGATIGYALARHDGNDAASLLKHADAAMYEGKLSGKRRLCRRNSPVELLAA